jgi:hypothetical protein
MKLACTLVFAIGFVAVPFVAVLPAGDLDSAARKKLLDHLNQSSSEFHDSIKGLTAEQWNYKPSPEVWSVAECAEHIAVSEDFIRGMVENKVLASAASPDRVAERKLLDDKVLKMITDRSFKAQAPEPLKPTRKFATPDAAFKAFQDSRKNTIALAKSRDDLREHAAPHPAFKEGLDGYQWLLFLSGHTMRHTAQIREVKENAGFPKGK